MSIEVSCNACHETKPLASTRVLTTCGHAFCLTCLASVLRRSPNDRLCPNCRIRFGPHQVLQVFLQSPSIATSSPPIQPPPRPRPPSPPPPPYSSLVPSDSILLYNSISVPSSSIPSSFTPSGSIPTSSNSSTTVHPNQNEEEDDTDVTRLALRVSQAFGKLNARSNIDELQAVINDLLTLSGCMVSSGPGSADRDGAIQACLVGISRYMALVSPVIASNTWLTHAEVARIGSVREGVSAGASGSTPLGTPSSSQHRGPAASVTVTHARCFVKNVTAGVTESLFRNTLTQRFGPVEDVQFDRPRACAFVEFATVNAARRAIVASLPVTLGGEGGVRIGGFHDAPRVLVVALTGQ